MTGGGVWNDLPGTSTLQAVREFSGNQASQTFNGKKYTVIAANTWGGAEAQAVAMGGHLARIDNAAENAFVAGLIAGLPSAWIGGTDEISEGDWRWSDGNSPFWAGLAGGSPVNGAFTSWNGGEPNDAGGNEDYAEMSPTGGWNDLPLGVTRVGVVEAPVPEPATVGLLALGALPLLARRRRRDIQNP